MVFMQKTNFLVKTDNICDYIPVISTATNLSYLFQKTVVIPFASDETIVNDHYYQYINEKSFARCITLLIPVVGNIVVGLYDLSRRDQTCMLVAIFFNHQSYPTASPELQNNNEFNLASLKQNGRVLKYLSPELKNNKEFVLAAVKSDDRAYFYANKELRGDTEITLAFNESRSYRLKKESTLLTTKLICQVIDCIIEVSFGKKRLLHQTKNSPSLDGLKPRPSVW